MKQRIKVKREALIEALRAREAKEKKEYEKIRTKYVTDAQKWRDKALSKLEGWEPNPDSYSNGPSLGYPPSKPGKPTCYEATIALLNMGATDEVLLNVEEYEQYMRGCRVR